ncbi:class I SAM-dependent methyltransferase [Adlercreutzia sp. ZJ304]|uniref:class I SAM-dependent methyltransferase n=1 Tax=Adlercreutzia sp. ZJ304 TaxID=2709791 RepID=UPI0013EDCF2D|nr:class I SAM-dependent methyltransferase [Adlercreutzia sp. ZJ304]
MDISTAIKLSDLTSAFYTENANSFSQTRTQSWSGWQRAVAKFSADANGAPKVLDLACGNMRFLQFLNETFTIPRKFEYYAVDNCEQLANSLNIEDKTNRINFQQLDLITALSESALNEQVHAPECDLCVCFGFMHHIPLFAWRIQLMQALAQHTRRGGYIVIAFWQFLKSERMRMKANESTEAAQAQTGITFEDPNDKLLGWQNTSNTFRYCHHFTENEISELVSALPNTREIDRFSADGKENLNRYVVLQKI